MGAVAGAILAAAAMYTYFLLSGAKELLASATARRKRLDAQAARLFGAAEQREGGAAAREERWRWFEAVAGNYASFVPGASVWLEEALVKGARVREGGEMGKRAVDEMVRRCHRELGEDEKAQSLSKNGTKAAWDVVYRSLNKVSDLEQGQDVVSSDAPSVEKAPSQGSGWSLFGGSKKQQQPVEDTVSSTTGELSDAERREQRAQELSGWKGNKQTSTSSASTDRDAQVRAAWLKSRSGKD